VLDGIVTPIILFQAFQRFRLWNAETAETRMLSDIKPKIICKLSSVFATKSKKELPL
jgi:hypothetical protein